jgi:hypothetical protein
MTLQSCDTYFEQAVFLINKQHLQYLLGLGERKIVLLTESLTITIRNKLKLDAKYLQGIIMKLTLKWNETCPSTLAGVS